MGFLEFSMGDLSCSMIKGDRKTKYFINNSEKSVKDGFTWMKQERSELENGKMAHFLLDSVNAKVGSASCTPLG